LALHTQQAPPAINTAAAINGAAINVAPEARKVRASVAVTTVYSLGGQNAALVFRNAP
jgi:3-oxoacyl-(acyl-carrier-protein) synthase